MLSGTCISDKVAALCSRPNITLSFFLVFWELTPPSDKALQLWKGGRDREGRKFLIHAKGLDEQIHYCRLTLVGAHADGVRA